MEDKKEKNGAVKTGLGAGIGAAFGFAAAPFIFIGVIIVLCLFCCIVSATLGSFNNY
jgi:hypothetical protein